MLYVRMALYAVFSAMAWNGFITFDPEAGTVTFQIDQLIQIIGGVGGYLATFAASRWAKHR